MKDSTSPDQTRADRTEAAYTGPFPSSDGRETETVVSEEVDEKEAGQKEPLPPLASGEGETGGASRARPSGGVIDGDPPATKGGDGTQSSSDLNLTSSDFTLASSAREKVHLATPGAPAVKAAAASSAATSATGGGEGAMDINKLAAKVAFIFTQLACVLCGVAFVAPFCAFRALLRPVMAC